MRHANGAFWWQAEVDAFYAQQKAKRAAESGKQQNFGRTVKEVSMTYPGAARPSSPPHLRRSPVTVVDPHQGADGPGTSRAADGAVAPELASATPVNRDEGPAVDRDEAAAVSRDQGADAPGTTAAAAVHVAEDEAVAPELASATPVNRDEGAAVDRDEAAAVSRDQGADAPGTTAAAAVHVAEDEAVAPALASATPVNRDEGAAVNCDKGAHAPCTAKKVPSMVP